MHCLKNDLAMVAISQGFEDGILWVGRCCPCTARLGDGGRVCWRIHGGRHDAGEQPLDATYSVEGEPVKLRNGRAERPAAPGSATTIRTQVVGAPVYADIDGDSDALLFLWQHPGGSGTFYYVAVAHKANRGYRGGRAVVIGDRISPWRLDVLHGVVVIDYLDRQ